MAGAALALRLSALRWAPAVEGDSTEYIALAQRLATAGVFSADGIHPSTYRPPLYPTFLAIGYRMGVPMPTFALIVQCLLGAATVFGTYVLGRRAFGSQVAMTAACALAAAPMTIRYSATLLTETTFTFLVISASLAWIEARPVTAGAALGLATLARAALGPFIPALALAACVFRRLSLARITLGAILVLSPWVARNYWYTGRLTIADAGFGTNLLFGTVRLDRGNPWGQLMKDAQGGVPGDLSEAEGAAARAAMRRIAAAPGSWFVTRAKQYPWLFLDNGVYLPIGANDVTFRQALSERRWMTIAVKAGFVAGNAVVLVAALVGLWRHRLRFIELTAIWAVPAYIAASHLPMYVEPRYGLPLEPYLLILAAASVFEGGTREGACATLDSSVPDAKVAELADAPDLGSGSRKAMGVRVPPFASIARVGANAPVRRSASFGDAGTP